MPWLTVKIRVKTDDVRKGGAGGTVTRLCNLCIDESAFELKDWTSSEFGHLQGKEELPLNMPEPRG